jgi:thioredoxin-related protein
MASHTLDLILFPALLTAAILACTPAAACAPAHASLRHAEDLGATARAARAAGVPLLIAFTETGCRYCARAREEYLVPLQASADHGARVVMREVDIRRATPLRDFSGQPVAPAQFARRYRVTRVPTVVVVDHDGNPLAEPIVGLPAEDFYRAYLQHAIDAGHLRLKRPAS